MDQLTAYKTLQLAPGSSLEEIRQAYAELSRRFHPEEYPEEFRQIHEGNGVQKRQPLTRWRKTM